VVVVVAVGVIVRDAEKTMSSHTGRQRTGYVFPCEMMCDRACDEPALPQQSVTEENETLAAALAVSRPHADLTRRRLGFHGRLFIIFDDMMEIGSRRVKTVCIFESFQYHILNRVVICRTGDFLLVDSKKRQETHMTVAT
jgi:hypothetical protein